MNFLVDAAWTFPPALGTYQGPHPLELLFIRVPFGPDFEQREGVDAHTALQEQIACALVGALGVTGRDYGVYRWPADDFIAWRARGPGDLGEDAIRDALLDALRPVLGDSADASSMSVAGVPLQWPSTNTAHTFARAVASAQRAASDPAGYQLECSASLLDRAIKSRAFVLHHQPIVDCSRQEVFAYESLCRGTMEGMKFPDLIFGVAERTDRVWQVGRVLRNIVGEELSGATGNVGLQFINIHPTDIDDPVFVQQAIEGALAPHANSIVFELTERAAIQDYPRVKSFFRMLRQRGYSLAIDDLGSGYAGLTALAELDPDFIKFDMSLIRDLHLHPVKRRLLNRMHQFASEIGARTISEGVETAHERDAVLQTGCTLMQGYFFARPARGFGSVPLDRFGAPPQQRGAI